MKTFLLVLLIVGLIALTWISLGWVALLVVPSMALFAMMTFTPLLTAWARGEELRNGEATLKNHSAPC